MKTLLKHSIKISLASLVAIKGGEVAHRKFKIYSKPAAALYEDTQDDIINTMLRNEFVGDLSKHSPERRAKYEFKLKTRDENLKELMDPKAEYDLLIVGGGASGAGVALDAAS